MTPMDLFEYARVHADPACQKCKGTGAFMYDHNHGTVCDLCCKHDLGWWQLGEHFGSRSGQWCCKAGCGYTIAIPPDSVDVGGVSS
jgi:hypothetical protein